MKPRINLITLGVADIARATAFYRRLGLPQHPFESEEVSFFALDGTWLALYPRTALAEDAGVPADDGPFAGITLAHNVASEAEVDAILKEAVEAGAELVKPAQKTFWGGYSGYFADPDGFLWEVAHVPQFWIGPQDRP